MKNNIEFKAVVLSVIITAAIKGAYNINIISIVVGINVVSAGISYYLLNKSEKRKAQELEEKEEQINKKLEVKEEKNNKKLEVIAEGFEKKIEANTKMVEEKLETITKVLEQRLETITKAIEQKLEADKEDFKEIQSLLKKAMEVNLEKKTETHKVLSSVNTQVQAIESIFNGVKLELEKGNNTALNLMEVEKDSLDKLIDCKSSLKSLEDKIENAEEHLRELEDVSKEKRDLIYSLKSETNRNFEDLKESNEKIEASYKQIHQSSISELVKLAAKNEYILNLLLDSYKVIKEIASTT